MKNNYIALLRGINVGGHNKIKMADLREWLQELLFEDLQTYIQSGNIIFTANEPDPERVAKSIREKIAEKCGFEVTVIVRTSEELEAIIASCPFSPATGHETKLIYFTLLSQQPAETAMTALRAFDCAPELWKIDNRTLYFFAANGAARAKLNNNVVEQKLQVGATTRNWNTMHKLLEMSR